MACVDGMFQSGPQQYHDAMALQRDSLHLMSNASTAIIRTAQEVKLINFRVYESQSEPLESRTKYPTRKSFVKKCSQIATGRRPSIQSTYFALQAPTSAQWVQRLPSYRSEYEAFLETALEEAVGNLVCGPNAAAEEIELGYNYDTLENAVPEAWVRVQAQVVEAKGKSWIVASTQSKAESNVRPEVYAHGRWLLINTKRRH